MTSSISQQEVDQFLESNFRQLEKDLYEQETTAELPTVYFRFGEENPLLTWTGLYTPHRS